MVMMAEPLAKTLEYVRASGNSGPVIAFSPTGERLTDAYVRSFSSQPAGQMVLVCGRYEGIDERFLETYVDHTVSLGDFVLSGAELAACALIDAVVRQLPGAIKELSASDESFSTGLLDAPHYTRPEVWRDKGVPEVLLTGHHANIAKWRRKQALRRTKERRPDMYEKLDLSSKADKKLLREIEQENAEKNRKASHSLFYLSLPKCAKDVRIGG